MQEIKKSIQYLKIISLCNGLVFFAPVALLLRTSRGISFSEFFLLQIILYASICFLEIPCGIITDKIGYKKSIIISIIFLFIARTQFLFAKSFFIFAIECILEAISICFISGTMNAYIYTLLGEEKFDQNISKIDNWGTVGFITSTASFYFIYEFVSLTGLIILTLGSTFIAFIASIKLEEINIQKSLPKISTNQFFKQLGFWQIALFSSIYSLGIITINFFYVVKLESLGIREVNMSWLILIYSAIQLFVPNILQYLEKESVKNIISKFIGMAGIGFIILFYNSNLSISLVLMIMIPTIIMIPYYVFNKIQNTYIDNIGMQKSRATILSLFSMGSNFLSIGSFVFLSHFNNDSGLATFFVIGVFYVIISVLCLGINFNKKSN